MEEYKIRDDMPDNGIRILSGSMPESPAPQLEDIADSTAEATPDSHPRKPWWIWIAVAAVAAVAAIACLLLLWPRADKPAENTANEHIVDITHNKATEPSSVVTSLPASPKQEATVEVTDVEFNHVPLKVFTINGGKAELVMGTLQDLGDNVLLAVHAADVRADNDEPVGVFVVNGEVKSRGQNKNGFCAILNGQITIGQQVETSLFERVINERGSFFRQFSIVSAGQPVELAPKGKALRRALCITNGQVQVVESQRSATYGDFAKALSQMGVGDALVLVGGNVCVYCPGNTEVHEGAWLDTNHPSENYLVWRK